MTLNCNLKDFFHKLVGYFLQKLDQYKKKIDFFMKRAKLEIGKWIVFQKKKKEGK